MINLENLRNQNPWWQDSSFLLPERLLVKRNLFYDLEKDLDNQFILSILGLRRVGKSTILRQIISHLLESKKHQQIFYYLFDKSSSINTSQFLEDLFSFYLEKVINKKIYELDQKIYIFLDEIQYIDNWQAILKRYYDLSNKKIKFIVSGSQSVLIRNQDRESLAGRIFEYYLAPLSFAEFLKIKKSPLKLLSLNKDPFSIRENFLDLDKFNYQNNQLLQSLSYEYVLSGQFPECLQIKDEKKKNKYILESVLGKVLDDLIKIKKIDKQEEFKLSAFQFLNNISSIFELKNIAREVGVSFVTIENYLFYLRQAYLFSLFYKKHQSIIRKGRSLKKIYTTSTNFISALNNLRQSDFDRVPDFFGKIMENLLFSSLSTLESNKFYFWRNERREVDFVLEKNKDILPFELKFKNQIARSDLDNLVYFSRKHKLKRAILVTKNDMKQAEHKGIDIYFLPFYLML